MKLSPVSIFSILGCFKHLIVVVILPQTYIYTSLLSNLYPVFLFPCISVYVIIFILMINQCVIGRIIFKEILYGK